MTVITATWLETWLTRLVLRGIAPVRQVGVGGTATLFDGPERIIVCGLAGALSPAAKPGTVILPPWVGLPSGERFPCDAALLAALTAATRILGHEPVRAPLLTSPALVTGRDRTSWAREGYVAVDMESAPLFAHGAHGAVIRVVLDAPERELDAIWEHPRAALRQPRVWIEAMRLAVDAPRAAWRGARVLKRALELDRQ